jgi:hypothetical protein
MKTFVYSTGMTDTMYRRKYLATTLVTGGGLVLAGCSGVGDGGSDAGDDGGSDAEATIREYINAFCSKDVENVNELQSRYGIEDDVTESELSDTDCSVGNIQEQSIPAATDEERFLGRDAISELRYYSFTVSIGDETQETTIMLALQNGEWKVLDIG